MVKLLNWAGGFHLYHERKRGDRRHRAEILRRVEGEILEQVRRRGDGRARRRDHDRVAVGPGFCERVAGDRAVGADLVFDDHGLAGELGEPVAVEAHHDVGARPRPEIAKRADFPRGVVLCGGKRREKREKSCSEQCGCSIGAHARADRHRLRGFLGTLARAGAEDGVALRTRVSVVPPMLVDGAVAANVGRLFARTCVNASYPEASLMRVGSLKALPKKLIPRGTPNTMPAGTWTMG